MLWHYDSYYVMSLGNRNVSAPLYLSWHHHHPGGVTDQNTVMQCMAVIFYSTLLYCLLSFFKDRLYPRLTNESRQKFLKKHWWGPISYTIQENYYFWQMVTLVRAWSTSGGHTFAYGIAQFFKVNIHTTYKNIINYGIFFKWWRMTR